MKVNEAGNLYTTGPGGFLIISSEGPASRHNPVAGDSRELHLACSDVKTLYMTARTGLYRVKLETRGVRP
jgi:gluconolactonase